MARSSNLSSDIDFIKEFEELRLKQRILIETLNRQKSSKEKELVHEINTKLDFLVNIFKDTAENAEFNEKEYLDSHFEALNKQLDGMKEHMEHSFADLYSKVEAMQIQAPISELKKEEIKTPELKSSVSETKTEEETSSEKKEATFQNNEVKKEETSQAKELEKPLEDKASNISNTQISSEAKKEETSQKTDSSAPPAPDFKAGDESGKKKKGWF